MSFRVYKFSGFWVFSLRNGQIWKPEKLKNLKTQKTSPKHFTPQWSWTRRGYARFRWSDADLKLFQRFDLLRHLHLADSFGHVQDKPSLLDVVTFVFVSASGIPGTMEGAKFPFLFDVWMDDRWSCRERKCTVSSMRSGMDTGQLVATTCLDASAVLIAHTQQYSRFKYCSMCSTANWCQYMVVWLVDECGKEWRAAQITAPQA